MHADARRCTQVHPARPPATERCALRLRNAGRPPASGGAGGPPGRLASAPDPEQWTATGPQGSVLLALLLRGEARWGCPDQTKKLHDIRPRSNSSAVVTLPW